MRIRGYTSFALTSSTSRSGKPETEAATRAPWAISTTFAPRKLARINRESGFCASQAAPSTCSSTIRGEILLPSINISAIDIGSWNRRGPALPGFTKKMPWRCSIRGL